MGKICLLAFLLLQALPSSAQDSAISKNLEQIYRQYVSSGKDSPEARINLLIKLDQDLRRLIDKPWLIANRPIDKKYWKAAYQAMGVGIGPYSDALSYSGKLLSNAKALDSNSTHSAYTLYADICGGAGSSADCEMPNLEAALRYEKEFPSGPFIKDTLVTLGMFYDDLFKVLTQGLGNGYKYDCFSKYIIRGQSLAEQGEFARKSAIHYYAKALAMDSENRAWIKTIGEFKDNVSTGQHPGWHFCAD